MLRCVMWCAWRLTHWAATCDLMCAEVGGTGRQGSWGTSDVAACDLVCAEVVIGSRSSGATIVALCRCLRCGVGF